MFMTTWLVAAWVVLVLLAGAICGTLLGWISASVLRSPRRVSWRDAVTGSAALFVLNILVNVLDNHIEYDNGQAEGWRGVVLNHKVVWATATLVVAVLGRRLVAARTASGGSEESAGVNGPLAH
jgi:hypothetical protein